MNIREHILAKAKTGVRLCDIPGSKYKAKIEFAKMVTEGLIIRKLKPGTDIPIYFDSVESARKYLSGASGLMPVESLRDIIPSFEVQRLPSCVYAPLEPSKIRSGYYQSV